MANKNSRKITNTEVISELHIASDPKVLHIDQVDMQARLAQAPVIECPEKARQSANALRAANIVKNIGKANAAGTRATITKAVLTEDGAIVSKGTTTLPTATTTTTKTPTTATTTTKTPTTATTQTTKVTTTTTKRPITGTVMIDTEGNLVDTSKITTGTTTTFTKVGVTTPITRKPVVTEPTKTDIAITAADLTKNVSEEEDLKIVTANDILQGASQVTTENTSSEEETILSGSYEDGGLDNDPFAGMSNEEVTFVAPSGIGEVVNNDLTHEAETNAKASASEESFFSKYKVYIIAAIIAVGLFLVLRKK